MIDFLQAHVILNTIAVLTVDDDGEEYIELVDLLIDWGFWSQE